jgi:hypothetical protein
MGLWGVFGGMSNVRNIPLLDEDAWCLFIAKDRGALLDKGRHALFLVFGCEG